MNLPQILSLILLVVILVLAVWRHVNIGLLGFSAAAIMVMATTAIADGSDTNTVLSSKDVLSHFPGAIVTLLIGVSLLFAHLEKSGGLSWFTDQIYAKMGHRTNIVPWIGYFIGFAISTAGAFSTASITLLVPVIAALGRKHPRLFFICEMAAIIGANTGALSPINPTGQVILDAAKKAHVEYSPWLVWFLGMLISFVLVIALQIVFQDKRVVETSDSKAPEKGFVLLKPIKQENGDNHQLQPFYAICSTIAVLIFLILVIFAKANVGLTALTLAVIMMLFFTQQSKDFVKKIPWNAVVVISGLLIFIGTMMQVDTMKAVEQGLLSMTSSKIALLFMLAYLTTFLSNVESSTLGVISLMIPMVFTIFGDSPQISLILTACAAPAMLSVVNPIHIAGTLVVSVTEEKQQEMMFKRLLIIAFATVPFFPGLAMIVPALMM
ncbi:SLC13 family permease [Snodgrassella alvi]|uniref:SLC13 family permease n=1 Tax=Snodgrassella alvi TaxID=1196083 RepID=UPI0034E1B6AE